MQTSPSEFVSIPAGRQNSFSCSAMPELARQPACSGFTSRNSRRRTLEAVDECELAFKDVDAVEMLHEQSRVEVFDAAVHLRR